MAELAIVISARDQYRSSLRNVSGEIAAIGRQAQGVSRQLKDAGKSLTDMGKKVTLGVSAPILGLAGAAVKAAADYEQLEVSFTTMLGSAEKAKGMMEELARFAAATPFESPEIQNAS
ncbi:hypothetical protein L0337_40330, partial [candidate division KSB1 bacterium]|nr:hypothetical protein [candidate division KSB1 bacterium]